MMRLITMVVIMVLLWNNHKRRRNGKERGWMGAPVMKNAIHLFEFFPVESESSHVGVGSMGVCVVKGGVAIVC